MSGFNGTPDWATVATVVPVVVLALLFIVMFYFLVFYLMRWTASSAKQQPNSTRCQIRNVADVKSQQSKPKNSKSIAVKPKNNNIKDSTVRLQEKKEKNLYPDVQKQQQNVINQNLEKINQQEKINLALKLDIRRQRQEIRSNEDLIDKQAKQIRRQQQELDKQQRQRKEENRQSKKKVHQERKQKLNDNPSPAINYIAAESAMEAAKTDIQPWSQSRQDSIAEVNVTKKQLCVENVENDASVITLQTENDKDLRMELKKTNQRVRVKVDNQQTPTPIIKVTHELPAIKMTHINDLTVNRDSDGDIKHPDCSEKRTTEIWDFEKKEICEKHDTTIRDLREEIDNMCAKYTNLWTDVDLNFVVDGVREEYEINKREAIEKLKTEHVVIVGSLLMEHEAEVRNLHMYYDSRIGELHMSHGITVDTLQRNHETLVCHLRNLNYSQGIRQEDALRSMRELKDKMRQEHQQEIHDIRVKYDDMIKEHEVAIKGLIKGKELLCIEYEKGVRDFREINQVLRVEIETIMKILRADHETAIKVLRNEIDSPVKISSPDLTKQNGTAVEGLQRNVAEEEQQRTIIIEYQLQTTNGHDDNDADITTSTNADDDADTPASAISNDDVEDMAQKLSLLHGYVSIEESNCSSQTHDLQQQLKDFKIDAHSPQNSQDNSKDEN